ncbi:MAG: hypothetical protein IJV15_10475 [Lachnospiraceae bacterium]|nr:hypothetical protein [Lachnospiraceae bacterium]
MKDIVMIGTGDFADLISDTIENNMQRNIAAYVIDSKFKTIDTYNDKPVYEFENIEKIFGKDNYSFVIGFIGSKMYTQRYEKYKQLKDMGYELENIIHSTASISKTSCMGDGNIILQYAIIANRGCIGSCNVICPKAYINHDVTVGNANYIAPGFSTTGYSAIGNYCFCGVNSAINNKIKVADYTFIGGGLFISKDTNEYDVYVPPKREPLKRLKSTSFQMFSSRRKQ